LTRRANQGHIGIIADVVKPAPKTGGGFFVFRYDPSKQFQFVETVLLHFMQFGNGSKWFEPSGKIPGMVSTSKDLQARSR